MCRESLHQHGPGSDTEPPASGRWTLGVALLVLTGCAGLAWLARRVWGA